MIHDCAFLKYFFQIFSPTVWIPLFKCVLRGRHSRFERVERVAVLPIGSIRKAAFHYSRFRIFGLVSKFVALSVRIPLFKCV